jgi:hypothetical protein
MNSLPLSGSGALHGSKELLSAVPEVSPSESVSGRDTAHPSLLPVCAEAIPEELKAIRQWVVWEADWLDVSDLSSNHRLRLVPCDPISKKRISPTEFLEGVSFETAWAVYREECYAGIGFVLTENDPFVVIQIGDALSGDGLPRIEAARALRTLTAYAERSPDGLGMTLLLRGHLPPGGCRRETVDLADTECFFPITGCRLPDSPVQIAERQSALEEYHSELFPSPPKRFVPSSNTNGISDEEVLRTAFNASNGVRMQQLYRGDTHVVPGGRNAADLALCSMLGFYTGNDAERLDRIFRKSTLFRPKWDSVKYSNGKTYGQATIAKALEGCLVFHAYPVHSPQAGKPTKPTLETYAERNGKKRKSGHGVHPAEELESDPAMMLPMNPAGSGNVPNTPLILPVGDTVNPIIFAEQMGRAEGLAQRETVLNAREAAHLLKISPKLLRRTIKPWRRFGGSAAGDRWLLSDLLSKIPSL